MDMGDSQFLYSIWGDSFIYMKVEKWMIKVDLKLIPEMFPCRFLATKKELLKKWQNLGIEMKKEKKGFGQQLGKLDFYNI